jgi:hypothetical protein
MRNVEPTAKPPRRLSVPLAVTITIALLIGAGLLVWWQDSPDRVGGAAPDDLVIRAHPGNTLTLLSEGGHEPAVLLYRGCAGLRCDWRVVFHDGRQYLLGRQDTLPEELTGLSPDGRVVALATEDGMVFRDLVMGSWQPGGPLGPLHGDDAGTRRAWSNDGRWLVHYNDTDLRVMVDTVSGKAHRLSKDLRDITIAGVTGDGRLLTLIPGRDGRGVEVAVSDPGGVSRADEHSGQRTVDLSGVLKDREFLTDGRNIPVEAYASPDSSRIAVTVRVPADPLPTATAVLVIDVASGSVVKRHDLAPADPGRTSLCGWDATGVQVLTGHDAGRFADPYTGKDRAVIHWLDPQTGKEQDRVTVQGELDTMSLRC